MANGFQFSTHFLSECVCVCVSKPVSKGSHIVSCFKTTQTLLKAGGQRPVFLRCPTKLQKTGGSIQGRLNVYLPFSYTVKS